ncbi:DUF6109 family natural product biosynthesis protein [Stigmatella sp. ncwal1]|uniref:DUF6109 family natural product biosynthesis protein n=1 Tax=Stigmatella ashevillensis TaxID=2995309 RepID=A0ABT5DLB3_9BACT|nr:DUF6109 family natural product biosynthesis protein [Stigmatella ashevillena]MDC0713147.1 DUF6109 family natural product biosynthesis protein [Stigmatella ashevillena]
MARPEHEERQQRRWLEDARKHLGRGDLEATLLPLLRLPPSLREDLLPRSAELFRRGVQEQHRRGGWGMLGTLAARADAEPRLVEEGVLPGDAQATFWVLMWAAGRAHEWARVRRLWQPLALEVEARAPPLAVALEAWMGTQGTPSSLSVAPALACLPPVDARLGIESARSRAVVPPPRSLDEVEARVLALCALEPFSVFVSRIEAWVKELPAEVARAVWQFVGALAARELWIRAAEDKTMGALSEPALLLGRAARAGNDVQALSVPVVQALRVLTARLPREGLSRAGEAEAWCSLAQAAAHSPEVLPWVVRAVSGVSFKEAALSAALRLHEGLLALAPDVALWAQAVLAWDEHNPEARSAPEWLQKSLRQLLETQAPALLTWLRAASPVERTELVECVAFTFALELVESWVEACWEGAGEEVRTVLSGAISILLDRTRDKKARSQMDALLRGVRSPEEAMQLLMGGKGALKKMEALMALTPEGLGIWRRLGSQVLPYRVEFLQEAVRQATSDAQAWEAAMRYLEAHERDPVYVETMQALAGGQWPELADRVVTQWLEKCADDVEALAEAAIACDRSGAPCQYIHPVLEAFLLTSAVRPPRVLTEAVKQARALARAHGLRLRKRRAPRKKKEASNQSPEQAPRRKRSARAKASFQAGAPDEEVVSVKDASADEKEQQ